MIDDLEVDAAVERAPQGVEDRLVGEFTGGDAQAVALRRAIDEGKARLQQAARQPSGFLIVRILWMRRPLVAEFAGEGLAGDGPAVEPDAVALVEFLSVRIVSSIGACGCKASGLPYIG